VASILSLYQVSKRLGCSVAEARALVAAHRFPNAYMDRDGKWRVSIADVETYQAWNRRKRERGPGIERSVFA
jgi:hypothetical protein